MFAMQILFKVIALNLLIVSLSQAQDDNIYDGYIKTNKCKVCISLMLLLFALPLLGE